MQVTDPKGHVTKQQYDARKRLILTTYDDKTTTQYAYDGPGNLIGRIDQANNTVNYTYDYANQLRSVVQTASPNPQKPQKPGTVTNYAISICLTLLYDDAGNQVQVTDPKGHVTKQQFDARKRLILTTYDDKTTTQYAYDGPGNLIGRIDQANNTVNYTYDYANQLRSVVQTASPNPRNTTAYQYDQDGNLITLTDANSHATENGFDLLSQLNQETMPAGQSQTRTYDAAGNLETLTDYNGKTTTYTYDSLNRLLTRTPDPSLPDAPESFTYTPTSKRATATYGSPQETDYYTYDPQDRLITLQTPQGTLTYTYDVAGNVASVQSSNANGIWVSYTYDSLNRLATVVDNRLPVGQNTTTYAYDPASNLATVTYPNGLQSSFTYDDLNRVTAMNAGKASYNYVLDQTGNRKQATESSGRVVNWSYDNIYRLTNETISLDPHSISGSVGYGLDPVGNRQSQTSSIPGIGSGSFTYDADDRLNTETYDANGNTLTSAGKTFAYDFANRLKSMTEGTVAVAIQYDADGNRVAKTVNGVTTRYLVDTLNPTGYAQVVEEVTAGAVARQYTYGLQRISQTQQIANAWTPSFYGYDAAGTVRLLTDSTGTVTDTYDFDAFGNTVNTTGSTPNVYLYRGEQYDPDLNLYYLRARYFNPLSGRCLTRDPDAGHIYLPASLHRYLYAVADPVNRRDPSGRSNVEFQATILKVELVLYAVTEFTVLPAVSNVGAITLMWGGALVSAGAEVAILAFDSSCVLIAAEYAAEKGTGQDWGAGDWSVLYEAACVARGYGALFNK